MEATIHGGVKEMAGSTLAGRLTLSNVSKTFAGRGGNILALDSISLSIEPGEFVSFVGGSGCGKSTLLRLAAGLDFPSMGEVRFGDRLVAGPGLERGVVFQDHRLLPWLTVWENVAFALEQPNRIEQKTAISRHIDLVGLRGFEESYPHQLSGGMAQRVALARALVNRPNMLLLDEPFGALDALTRMQQQQEILRIWEIEQVTMVLVTHDIDEAIFLSNRVVVLSARPGTVKGILPVELPRPRQRSSPEFVEMRRAVYRRLFGEEDVLLEYMI
jgi:sulfonate transport system ATP-binding protein